MPYRLSVGMVVFNEQGQIWLGQRQAAGVDSGGPCVRNLGWQFPQGGVEQGEDLLAAAKRELYEETGMKSLKFLAQYEAALYYDFPEGMTNSRLAQYFRGQKQYWFAFLFLGKEAEIAIDPPPDGHAREFDKWKWASLDTAVEEIVEFKKNIYKTIAAAFKKYAIEQPQ